MRTGWRVMTGAAALAAFSVLAGPGTAYASGIDVLPNLDAYVADGLGVVEAYANGITVGGATAIGDGAVLTTGPFAPLVLAGAAGMYAGWKLGDAIGSALPCLDCPPASSAVATTTDTATGISVSQHYTSAHVYATVTVPAGYWYVSLGGHGSLYGWTFDGHAYMTGPLTASYDFADDGAYGSFNNDCTAVVLQNASPSLSSDFYGNTTAVGGCGTSSGAQTTTFGSVSPTGQPLAIQTTTTVRHSDGTTSSVVALGTPFHATDATFPPITVAPLGSGDTRVGFGATVVPTTSGSTVAPTTIVPTETLPTAPTSAHPEEAACLPGGAQYPCLLRLAIVLPDGTTRPYDPSIDYNGGAAPVGVSRCTYGTLSEPTTECRAIYRQVPTTSGTSTTSPTEAVSANGNCLSSAVSWNPIDWVYIPVKCALAWAFVPPPGSLQTAEATASAGFTSTGLPAWGSAVGGVGTGLAAIGNGTDGCAGPHFAFTLSGHSYAFDPLNACSDPMKSAAVVIKLFASLSVLVAGARFCARPLLTAFGMGAAV